MLNKLTTKEAMDLIKNATSIHQLSKKINNIFSVNHKYNNIHTGIDIVNHAFVLCLDGIVTFDFRTDNEDYFYVDNLEVADESNLNNIETLLNLKKAEYQFTTHQLNKAKELIQLSTLLEGREEVEFVFFLENNEIGYGYTLLVNNDNNNPYRSYMYQDRFSENHFLSDTFDDSLENATLYIGDHQTHIEAAEEIIKFWFGTEKKWRVVTDMDLKDIIKFGRKEDLFFIIY